MSVIPEKHLEFCRKVSALAAEAGINRATLKYTPGCVDEWQDEINMHWEQGWYGEASRRVFVTSTVRVQAELKTSPP